MNHGWDWRVQAGSNNSALAANFETRDLKLVVGGRASAFLKAKLNESEVSYVELAKRLKKHGFAETSGDAEQGYFADGMVEDIITVLSLCVPKTVTGVGAAAIRAMMHSGVDPKTTTFFDQPIPWSALERSKRRISPGRATMDDAPFLRALWSIRVISRDPTSGERLVNRCTCGQPLGWWSMHELLECSSCGRPPRESDFQRQ